MIAHSAIGSRQLPPISNQSDYHYKLVYFGKFLVLIGVGTWELGDFGHHAFNLVLGLGNVVIFGDHVRFHE